MDEIGTPYCITVDFHTLENGTVTVRERDSTEHVDVDENDLSTEIDGAHRFIVKIADFGECVHRSELISGTVGAHEFGALIGTVAKHYIALELLVAHRGSTSPER